MAKKLSKGFSQTQIAEFCGVHVGTIEHYVAKFNLQGIKKRIKETANNSVSLNNPYFLYFIGLFLSDGYFHSNGVIEISQTKKASTFELLGMLAEKLSLQMKSYDRCYRIYGDQNWGKLFKKVTGLEKGPKTWDADFPKFYELSNLQQTLIIRGLIDGDGTVKLTGSEIDFFSVSPHLLNLLKTYLINNDISYGIHKQDPGYNMTICKDGLKFGLMLYDKFPSISLSYKRDRIQKKVNDIVRTYSMIKSKKSWIKS